MKLGILETDRPESSLQKIYGSYNEMFQELFSSVDRKMVYKNYDVTQLEYPKNINDCDAYLITGSKASPYEDFDWIRRFEEEIKRLHRHQKKLIGICFGHQIIAQALGGCVKKSEKGWGVGTASRRLYQQKPWMGKGANQFKILVSHQDQVSQLPPGAECIAGNEFCPHASFQMGKHILTFQGHPEFKTGYLRQLITGRRNIIGEARTEQALQSLGEETEHPRIAQWIVKFLKN